MLCVIYTQCLYLELVQGGTNQDHTTESLILYMYIQALPSELPGPVEVHVHTMYIYVHHSAMHRVVDLTQRQLKMSCLVVIASCNR